MPSPERVWMTRQGHNRLQSELSALQSPPSIEVPDDFMDCDEDRIAAHLARRARIGQIHGLLAGAAVGQDPDDDGVAEPGMVLTVRFDDTGETETFLLGVRGAEDADIEVYSLQSPLGRAIAGARRGERRSYSIPSGTNLPVTLLHAVPYGQHGANTLVPQKIRERSRGSRPALATPGQHSPHTRACIDGITERGLLIARRRADQ